ncbi:MAG: diaminopimelate epimerase, partial [Planctomycetaceae bacterium]|nr:diaminopimelate epimerase [Planctomycetaceae bacterium]
RGTAVSVGNPHLVVPVDDGAGLDLERIGPLFENHPLFPKRVNTEFVQVEAPDRVRMRVWERGSGETMACGTGACATVVACALNSLTGRRATVRLLGGDLLIEWAEDDTIFMTGPATLVATGEYFVPDF